MIYRADIPDPPMDPPESYWHGESTEEEKQYAEEMLTDRLLELQQDKYDRDTYE